jgi:Leucine-rich repeat (LRR) protein
MNERKVKNNQTKPKEMFSEIMKWYEEGDEVAVLCLNPEYTELPILPENVKHLSLERSHIEVLDNLPPCLESLVATNSKLDEIKSLPKTLRVLNIGNTNVKVLPELPQSLEILVITNCGMYKIPKMFHTKLKMLLCGYNFMETMPPLPDSLETLDCNGCIYLSTFARLPMTLHTFSTDFTEFEYQVQDNISDLSVCMSGIKL